MGSISERAYPEGMRESSESMSDLLERLAHAGTIDALGDALSRLSLNIEYYCSVRRINVQMFQEASRCITRMRLVLRDLERGDVLSKGACKELAGKYTEMESRIRRVSLQLMHAMRQGH